MMTTGEEEKDKTESQLQPSSNSQGEQQVRSDIDVVNNTETKTKTDGMRMKPKGKNEEYDRVVTALLSHPHIFYSFPTSPHALLIPQDERSRNSSGFSSLVQKKHEGMIPTISSLSLHPALESTLHILNGDLPSAHFLLRHAQAGPAWEMMYLHGVLHRIEGDVDNARAWYGNVAGTDVLDFVWNQSSDSTTSTESTKKEQENDGKYKSFLDRIERVRDSTKKRKGSKMDFERKEKGLDWEKEMDELTEISLWEIRTILKFCENKFGTERVVDASPVWVQPDKKHSELRDQMIVGGEGWREF